MTCQCQDCIAPYYLTAHWTPVSETSSRQHLRLAASNQLTVVPHQRVIYIYGGGLALGRLLSPVRQRGPHCRSVPDPSNSTFVLAVFSKHFSSQSTNVCSALEALARIRHIKWRFTLTYITLHYITYIYMPRLHLLPDGCAERDTDTAVSSVLVCVFGQSVP